MPIVSFYLLTVHSYLHPLTLNEGERKKLVGGGGHLTIHLVRIMNSRRSRLSLKCPCSLWNGHTVYTETCQCMPNQFPSTKYLIDNWCTLETFYQTFDWWKSISVCASIFHCKRCNHSKANLDTQKFYNME